MCLNTGTSENYHFPFKINGKIVVLGVPILKHFGVNYLNTLCLLEGEQCVFL